MPSTERARRHRRQSGQGIVEALVASAVLGVAVVIGLSALDASALGARRATNVAWAQCVARGEAEAIMAGAYDGGAAYPAPVGVTVSLVWQGPGPVQELAVQVKDPESGTPLLVGTDSAHDRGLTFYKSAALSGSTSMSQSDADQASGACGGLRQSK